jgi:hypothetical protein
LHTPTQKPSGGRVRYVTTVRRFIVQPAGFTKTGVRPKMFYRDGQYIDDIIMTIDLS